MTTVFDSQMPNLMELTIRKYHAHLGGAGGPASWFPWFLWFL